MVLKEYRRISLYGLLRYILLPDWYGVAYFCTIPTYFVRSYLCTGSYPLINYVVSLVDS